MDHSIAPFLVYIFLSQCIILCNQSFFVNAKALIGENVRQANHREFPYVVALLKVNPVPQMQISRFCTGTLISNKDVLTAEHCMKNLNISFTQVSIGSTDYRYGKKYNVAWWISFNKWIEQLTSTIEDDVNDIAIIKLDKVVPNVIKPARLSFKTNEELFGLDVAIAGWGRTQSGNVPLIMETVDLKILSTDACTERLSNLYGKKVFVDFKLLCTAAVPSALITHGDSGDPILLKNEIVGVTSGTFQKLEYHPERVNIHFGILYYKNFILDIINYF